MKRFVRRFTRRFPDTISDIIGTLESIEQYPNLNIEQRTKRLLKLVSDLIKEMRS